MTSYLLIRRLRWPALILLTGVIALLSEWDILDWGKAWPLYLILWGVLQLAERAALANMDPIVAPGGYPSYGPPVSTVPPTPQATAIVPAAPENHSGESGQ